MYEKIFHWIWYGVLGIACLMLIFAIYENCTLEKTPTKIITEDNRTFTCEYFMQYDTYISCDRKKMPIQSLGIYEIIPPQFIREEEGEKTWK